MNEPADPSSTGASLPPLAEGPGPSGEIPPPDAVGGPEDAISTDADTGAVGQPGEGTDGAAPAGPSRPRLPDEEPARSRVIAGIAAGAVAIVGVLGALVGGGGSGFEDAGSSDRDPPVVVASSDLPSVTPPDSPAETTATTPSGTEPPVTATVSDPPTTEGSVVEPSSPPPPPSSPSSSAGSTPTTAVGVVPTTLLADPSATTTSIPASRQLVQSVVPDVAAWPDALDPVGQAQTIAELASTPRNDVASPGPVGSLCAVVRLREEAQLEGRWERDGDELDSTDLSTVGAPGFGDCLVSEAGTPLEEGAYQFLVADRDGHESATGTFVIGAVPLEQIFVNTSSANVCVIRLAPSSAGHYDAYDFTGAPLLPGASVVIPIADVDHDVRVDSCDPTADPIEEFDFNPAAGVPRSLVD